MRASVALPFALAFACACESFVATDGRVFAENPSHSTVDPWPLALIASGSHDLDCESSNLRIVSNYRDRSSFVIDPDDGFRLRLMEGLLPPLGVVEGCGSRATYNVIDGRLVMSDRVQLAGAK